MPRGVAASRRSGLGRGSGVRRQMSLTTSAGMTKFASGMNQPAIVQPGVQVRELVSHNSVFFDAR